jgi:hypothetical protein
MYYFFSIDFFICEPFNLKPEKMDVLYIYLFITLVADAWPAGGVSMLRFRDTSGRS